MGIVGYSGGDVTPGGRRSPRCDFTSAVLCIFNEGAPESRALCSGGNRQPASPEEPGDGSPAF